MANKRLVNQYKAMYKQIMVIMEVIDAKVISDTYAMGYKAGYKVAKEEKEIKVVD